MPSLCLVVEVVWWMEKVRHRNGSCFLWVACVLRYEKCTCAPMLRTRFNSIYLHSEFKATYTPGAFFTLDSGPFELKHSHLKCHATGGSVKCNAERGSSLPRQYQVSTKIMWSSDLHQCVVLSNLQVTSRNLRNLSSCLWNSGGVCRGLVAVVT